MAGNQVKYTASAYEDLDRITDYLIERNPEAAWDTYVRLTEAAKRLREFPFMGPMMNDPDLRAYGYRRLIVDDYSMIYQVFDGLIVIYHIFNHRQDYAGVFAK